MPMLRSALFALRTAVANADKNGNVAMVSPTEWGAIEIGLDDLPTLGGGEGRPTCPSGSNCSVHK